MNSDDRAQALSKQYQHVVESILKAGDTEAALRLRASVVSVAYSSLFTQIYGEKKQRERPPPSRLFALARAELIAPQLRRATLEFAMIDLDAEEPRVLAAHRLGELLDLLLASEKSGERRRLGSYFTPHQVARGLIERSFEFVVPQLQRVQAERPLLMLCDPACGGGAFLVEAIRRIQQECVERFSYEAEEAWAAATACAHGIDISPLAIATTEAALLLLAPTNSLQMAHFQVGDALIDAPIPRSASADKEFDFSQLARARFNVAAAFPAVFSSSAEGFDWIVGNPPWVAFQGRATQPIEKELRAFYKARYVAFTGYPTTQGMFAERAVELAPRGVVSLLVPSSLSDLDGYAQARRAVTKSHRIAEPLLEFGQDAFAQVVQPCFGLIAVAKQLADAGSDAPFQLEERARLESSAQRVEAPACLKRLEQLPVLPPATFGELGFQSNTRVVRDLFRRGDAAVPPFTLGLLEGRCVREFVQTAPRVFLNPDREILRSFKVSLRQPEVYQAVDFVVRQTAAFTIAARHDGSYFRNSLIAGYASGDLDSDLLVGLLNSALYRCVHLSRQRDARQATFPQVKVAHLRRLPAPPAHPQARASVRELSALATQAGGLDHASRAALDRAVFQLFEFSEKEGEQIVNYLLARQPKALSSLNEM